MNFTDTLKSVELILNTDEVAMIVGESGIGKTALAKKIAFDFGFSLVNIDANLLKEGEIGGLPTIEEDENKRKITVYALHTKLKEIDIEISKGKKVLLFIDELNRCEHTVQQELMNLILNREINGYKLDKNVKILAAMNPSNFDYQVVEMDKAQENRFVWLNMKSEHNEWIMWAMENNIEEKVIEFISTFPEYLYKKNDDDINATPRSYERLSKAYKIYKQQKDTISKNVFLNVVKGNVGRVIAEEFVSFVNSNSKRLINYEDIFLEAEMSKEIIQKIKSETHTRLYLTMKNILKNVKEKDIDRFIEFLSLYPIDLMVGIMKDIKASYKDLYEILIENEKFVDLYFDSYKSIRG